MVNRVVLVLIVIPIAVLLIALAVANRAPVPFTLDPFNPGSAGLTVTLPLFVIVFLAVVTGMIIGSMATWLRQGQYRKMARRKATEAEALKARLAEPRPVQPSGSTALATRP